MADKWNAAIGELALFMKENPESFVGVAPPNLMPYLGQINPNLWSRLADAYQTEIGSRGGNSGGEATRVLGGRDQVPNFNEWATQHPEVSQAVIDGFLGQIAPKTPEEAQAFYAKFPQLAAPPVGAPQGGPEGPTPPPPLPPDPNPRALIPATPTTAATTPSTTPPLLGAPSAIDASSADFLAKMRAALDTAKGSAIKNVESKYLPIKKQRAEELAAMGILSQPNQQVTFDELARGKASDIANIEGQFALQGSQNELDYNKFLESLKQNERQMLLGKETSDKSLDLQKQQFNEQVRLANEKLRQDFEGMQLANALGTAQAEAAKPSTLEKALAGLTGFSQLLAGGASLYGGINQAKFLNNYTDLLSGFSKTKDNSNYTNPYLFGTPSSFTPSSSLTGFNPNALNFTPTNNFKTQYDAATSQLTPKTSYLFPATSSSGYSYSSPKKSNKDFSFSIGGYNPNSGLTNLGGFTWRFA